MPHPEFFRRRGEPALRMVGVRGESFTDVEEYLQAISRRISRRVLASSDMRNYADMMRGLAAGTLTPEQAIRSSPTSSGRAEVCPCSKSARWVEVENATDQADGHGNGNGHKS